MAGKVSENISMEMLKIEQVIVGSEVRSTSTEIKYEPKVVPLQSCKLKLYIWFSDAVTVITIVRYTYVSITATA